MKTKINNKTSIKSLQLNWRKSGVQKLMLCALVTGMLLVSFSSCEKSELRNPNATNNFAQATAGNVNSANKLGQTTNNFKTMSAADILDESIANWNLHFGNSATALGYMYIGQITDEANRQSVVAAITDPSSFAPFGNVTKPTSVGVKQLNDFTYDPAIFGSIVDSLVLTSHDLYMVNWMLNGSNTPFSTLCIFSGNEFVYDNIIANVMLADNSSQKNNGGENFGNEKSGNDCEDQKWHKSLVGLWLWGTERGRAEATVKLACDWSTSLTAPGTGFYYDCIAGESEYFAWGEMFLGSHQEDIVLIPAKDKKRCVKARGVLSLSTLQATVTATFNVAAQKFEIQVSGIGGVLTERFEKALCCDK